MSSLQNVLDLVRKPDAQNLLFNYLFGKRIPQFGNSDEPLRVKKQFTPANGCVNLST